MAVLLVLRQERAIVPITDQKEVKDALASVAHFVNMSIAGAGTAINNVHTAREMLAAALGTDADGLEDLREIEQSICDSQECLKELVNKFTLRAESLPD